VTGDQPAPREGPPSAEERYVVVDLAVLEAIRQLSRELSWPGRVDKLSFPTVELLLRVVRIDPVTNNLVIGVKVARDLHEGPPPEQR
jgi:hypothetical protein